MKIKFLIIVSLFSLQASLAQETRIDNVKAKQEKLLLEQQKAEKERIKGEEKIINKKQKDEKERQKALKKAERAQKKSEKALAQREKAIKNVKKAKSKIKDNKKDIEKEKFEKLLRKRKLTNEEEIEWKEKILNKENKALELQLDLEKAENKLDKLD